MNDERSVFEHKHDDWRGFQGTSEPNHWLDTSGPSIDNPAVILPRMLTMVQPGTHLHVAVVNNVAVRLPEYEVDGVFYFYYPDLLARDLNTHTGVQVDVHKRGSSWDDADYDEQLATIEYMVTITELAGVLPLAAIADDGHIKEEFAERLQAVMRCPDCMYYRMLHEGTLEYMDGREQTNGQVAAAEEEAV